MNNRTRLWLASAGLFVTAGKLPPVVEAPTPVASRLANVLAQHIKATPSVVGEALAVVGPGARWQWSGGAGHARVGGETLTAAHVFRIASVTKPFTAAAILRLMEDGRIDIDGPIAPLIGPSTAAALSAGGYTPSRITVRQLLSHTSGLYDYAADAEFAAQVRADPAHRWSRSEQIAFAMRVGKPYGAPGERYAYSDTGYIVLGEIVERITGQPLGPAVRALLDFRRLGLNDTYWERFEAAPRPARRVGHVFYGAQDMAAVDPSFDLYGGGGLVSSVGDVARFYRALVRGEVFHDRRTLAAMMSVTTAARAADAGIHNNGVALFKLGPHDCWGHGGFWGTVAAYCPTTDVAFAWTMNQADDEPAYQRFKDLMIDALAPRAPVQTNGKASPSGAASAAPTAMESLR